MELLNFYQFCDVIHCVVTLSNLRTANDALLSLLYSVLSVFHRSCGPARSRLSITLQPTLHFRSLRSIYLNILSAGASETFSYEHTGRRIK